MGTSKKKATSTIELVLVGKPFWNLWGGQILATVIMSAIVACALQIFEHGIKEVIDTTVQNTLLVQLSESAFAPDRCSQNDTKEIDKKRLAGCITVIGIDDSDFRDIFRQRSPLNPDELRKLFDALKLAPPRVVAIDLDLSPASADDWPARERLLNSLTGLSKVTQLVMVCPQGYSTSEPGKLDKEWVQRFGSEVQFASPNLGVDGLYYDQSNELETIGMVVASAAAHKAVQHPEHVDWNQICHGVRTDSTRKPDQKLIRPARVAVANFTQAVAQPQMFANRIVLIGGKWGINDQFNLRGQSEPFYGVNLHAWVTATELSEPKEISEAAKLVLDVFIGMTAGAVFVWTWGSIAANRQHFGKRSFYYLLFFALAFGLPIVWVVAAAHLAKLGVVLGAAGMILSAAADSFLSSHEALFESPEKEHGITSNPVCWHVPVPTIFTKFSWRDALVTSISIGIPVVLFSILFTYGHDAWVGLVCGISTGIIFGCLDHYDSDKEDGHEKDFDQPENICDLVSRFVWLVLKAAALIWAAATSFDTATSALLIAFIVSWSLSYSMLNKYD